MVSSALGRTVRRALLSRCRASSTLQPIATASSKINSPLFNKSTLVLPRSEPQVFRWNRQLRADLERGNLIPSTIAWWNRMLEADVRPDALSYMMLLRILASRNLWDTCLKVWEDMVETNTGDKLTGLNWVMRAAVDSPAQIAQTLELFAKHGLTPDITTYQHYLTHFDHTDNLERAIQLLNEMPSANIQVNKACVRTAVSLAARMGAPMLAMDLYLNEKELLGPGEDHELVVAILMSAAACLDTVVTKWSYELLTATAPDLYLTEPLCVDLLNMAHRNGIPELAEHILNRFKQHHIAIQEHHLAPLIRSYCSANKIQGALEALNKYDEHNVELEFDSLEPLVNAISRDTDKLDDAYDILLALPKPVNTHAANVVFQAAAIGLADLPRAIGIYKHLLELGWVPTTATFDILLAGCLKVGHRPLGEKLFSDLRARNLKPSSQTYTRLILLSLTGEEEYESAFERLEEMKAEKMTPPVEVYDALVRRLVNEKDPRADLALEDMGTCGYQIGADLKRFLLGGKNKETRSEMNQDGKGADGQESMNRARRQGTNGVRKQGTNRARGMEYRERGARETAGEGRRGENGI